MAATITQDILGLHLGLGHLFECTEFQDEVRSRSEQYLWILYLLALGSPQDLRSTTKPNGCGV